MHTTKQRVAELLRATHLLRLADSLMLARGIFQHRQSNRAFLAANPTFVAPPYRLAFDAYNHINWRAYMTMGTRHAALIADLLRRHVDSGHISLLEWGCGPARVIRHLRNIDGFAHVDCFGSDYNASSVAWCNQHIGGAVFVENALRPPLAFPAGKFDCIYAISIFTHLSEALHRLWIDELQRVLKPGGVLIFTTHGDICARRLSADDRARYDSGEFVVRDKIPEGKKHFAAYQPHRFVRERLLKGWELLEHITDPSAYSLEQEVWVARKPGSLEAD